MSQAPPKGRPRPAKLSLSRKGDQASDLFVSGEIWWAYCSITAVVLEAAEAYSSVAPSESMVSDYMNYKDDKMKIRPVIVVEAAPHSNFATVVPLATFGGLPISRLSKHFQRLAISVGNTAPWPTATSKSIQITPSWPRSDETPCYAIAHLTNIPRTGFVKRYTSTAGSGTNKKKTERFAVPAVELSRLALSIQRCIFAYDKATPAELHEWNNSWIPRTKPTWQPRPAQSLPAFPARSEGPVHHRVQPLRPPRMQWDHAQARAVMPNFPPVLESPINSRFEKPSMHPGSETALSATAGPQDVNVAPNLNHPNAELTPKENRFPTNTKQTSVINAENSTTVQVNQQSNLSDKSPASLACGGKSPVSPKFPLFSPSPPRSATLSPHAQAFVPKSLGGMARMRVAMMSRLYTQTDVGHVVQSRRPPKQGVGQLIQAVD